jgi:zona occludens toxin (predicted ATPase)
MAEKDAESWTLSFLMAEKDASLKNDRVKLSELFPTLKKSKSNFPSFIQHKKWQSPIFQIYSNHKIGKSSESLTLSFFRPEKNIFLWKSWFSHFLRFYF